MLEQNQPLLMDKNWGKAPWWTDDDINNFSKTANTKESHMDKNWGKAPWWTDDDINNFSKTANTKESHATHNEIKIDMQVLP